MNDIYLFSNIIDFDTVDEFINNKPDIFYTLYFNTEGGNTNASVLLAKILQEDENLLEVVVVGECFSAGVIVISLLKQHKPVYALPNASFLIHRMELKFDNYENKIKDIETFLKHYKKIEEKIEEFFVRGSHLSVEDFRTLTEKGDFFFTAEEALKMGYIDKILEV